MSDSYACAMCHTGHYAKPAVTHQVVGGGILKFCSQLCHQMWMASQENFYGASGGMKDSGARQTFETGAMREPAEGRYDLISPFFLRRLAIVMDKGAKKYADRNWEKGFKHSQLVDHLLRHIVMYMAGDREEDHLGHAAFNLMALMHLEFTHPELGDMPKYPKEGERVDKP